MECFGHEEIIKKDRSGVVTDTSVDYYYILPIPVGAETYYVAYKINDKDKKYVASARLAKATMDYVHMESDIIDAKVVKISGGLVKLDKELHNHMMEWFEENEWFENEEDINKYVLPLTFTMVYSYGVRNDFQFILLVLGVEIPILTFILIGDLRYSKRLKHMAALKNRQINIAGRDYCVARMDVDRMIWSGKLGKAKKTLMKKYKATEEEADAIINSWDQITSL